MKSTASADSHPGNSAFSYMIALTVSLRFSHSKGTLPVSTSHTSTPTCGARGCGKVGGVDVWVVWRCGGVRYQWPLSPPVCVEQRPTILLTSSMLLIWFGGMCQSSSMPDISPAFSSPLLPPVPRFPPSRVSHLRSSQQSVARPPYPCTRRPQCSSPLVWHHTSMAHASTPSFPSLQRMRRPPLRPPARPPARPTASHAH
eukprot:151777-Chlamydomonas_euryale.AAC.1